jgi:hypothetical protein
MMFSPPHITKEPTMIYINVIRSNNEDALKVRRRGLINAGVTVSLMALETPSDHEVYTFDAHLDSDTAHLIPRSDDRWQIANQFFQAAAHADSRRGQYAQMASDWASFDYKNVTLQQRLDAEHARQERQAH